MEENALTHRQVKKAIRLSILLILFITILLLSLFSCSVQNDLMKSDWRTAKMITWVGEDYIYTGTYAEPKMDSMPYYKDRILCPGDWVIRE